MQSDICGPYVTSIPVGTGVHPRNVYLTSWFVLSVLFLTGGETLWSLHVSGILHGTWTSTPGRNVYLTSWFILSVLFLDEMSVVPTCVWDPLSHSPPS